MKRFTITLIIAIAVSLTAFTQIPQALKYQAVARNLTGDILAEQNVSFQISILEGSAGGTDVYVETHTVLTNQFGLANLNIGNGVVVSGTFATIDWGSNSYFLQIEMDAAGGSTYQLMGTSQLLSVPYALFSENTANPDDSDWTINLDDMISNVAGNVGIGTTTPYSRLSVNGTGEIGTAIFGETSDSNGLGVHGKSTNASTVNINYGGFFESAGESGRGVFGYASNTTGENYGGRFWAAGTDGIGVYGKAFSTSGLNYGGFFESEGTSGQAVFGRANYTGNVTNYGGWFKAKGNQGRGVYGIASSSSGINYGGYFESSSNSGRAVYGRSTNTSGTNFGGYFQAEGPTGQAVFGLAAGTTAINYGGWFKAKGNQGRAVYGEASDVNGTNYGGYFLARSITGRAVFGLAEYVVDGENYGGWFKGKGDVGGTGVYAWGNVYDFYADGPGTNYAAASSRRWKKNIVEIDSPLEKIEKLRGVYYDWIEDRGGRHDIGMIAEEVGEVIPEIVEYEKNGIDARGMDYSKLTPLLVEAMKELNRKMDHFLEENQNLKEEIARLKMNNLP